ncbi:MAG: family 16 glycoside hydrolase [Thermoguttaceae bacterium]|jgi:hypothetical protein
MRHLLAGFVWLLTMAWAIPALAAEKSSGDWKYLFDGRTLQVAEGEGVFRAVDGRIEAAGPGGRLVLGSDLERAALRSRLDSGGFLLEMEVLTEPGADCGLVIPMPAIPDAVEVRINNGGASPARKPEDLARTGSLTGLRNQFKSIVGDGEWFKLGVAVHGPRRKSFCRPLGSGALGYFVISCAWRVQVMVNGILVADYSEPAQRRDKPAAVSRPIPGGILAIDTHARHAKAVFRGIRLCDRLPAAEEPLLLLDDSNDQITALEAAGFPLVDFHIHLKGGLTVEQALAQSRSKGIFYGIAANCGLKFPITDDRGIDEYLKKMAGQPCFVGMQAEGREWPTLFSRQAIAKFDYVFSDAMTIVDHRGRRARLWITEEVDIPDTQAFMELLVRTIEDILKHEPIDIYANPTYLPAVIAKDYDALWTPERVRRVIRAVAASGVAVEISNSLRLPKPDFIRQAKLSGIKFTFGTNNSNPNLGRDEYALEMIRQCGLTWQDMWLPKRPKGTASKGTVPVSSDETRDSPHENWDSPREPQPKSAHGR